MARLSPSARRALRGATPPLILLLAWEIASHSGAVDPRFLPPLEDITAAAWSDVNEGAFATNLGASLFRTLAGFLLGTSFGLVFGVLLGLSRITERLFGPSFNGLKQIALYAWIPLISMWFGIGEVAKIVFVALAAFVPVTINTQEGVRNASIQLVEVGKTFMFNRWQFIKGVFLPSALPSILTGIHLALIYAWLATIGTEYFMTVGLGIGHLIVEGRERFQMDLVLLGILVLGLVGFGLDWSARLIETRLIGRLQGHAVVG
jgi:sulfonate transport system permease protein